MRKIAVIAALLFATTADAQAQYYSLGRGNRSCAIWLSSPTEEAIGGNYIQGMWTGLNAFNSKGMTMTGSKTDTPGILAEVKKVCTDAPSMPLVDAVLTAYVRVQPREDADAR